MGRAGRLARRVAACAAFAVTCACGGKGDVQDDAGVWRYGVPRIDAGSAPTAAGPAAPIARRPVEEPSAAPSASAPAATTPTRVPEAPPSGPAPAAAGSYRVVEAKAGTSPGASGASGAVVRGVAKFAGGGQNAPIVPSKNQDVCGASHPSERLVVGEGGGLANCFVSIPAIAEGKDWPKDAQPEDRVFFVDQKRCAYVPHVGWFRTQTQLSVGNSDPTEHNIHGYRGPSTQDTKFNFSTPPNKTVADAAAAFVEEPGVYFFKCDIHPWMNAYQHASANPYADVTSETADAARGRAPGEFVIDGVPDGEWDVVCWHEGMREEPQVNDGKVVAYQYSPPIVEVKRVTVKGGVANPARLEFSIPYR